ncbi:MAG: response regulator [Candidatus Auribacterota bacterium]|nr:response regulator [Candidatus Auribacterota bacterium]
MSEQKTILIVDDDPLSLKTLSQILEVNNYSVITAETGKDAIEIVNIRSPDLIILDYIMPDGDGVFVITMLRSALETFTIPVIFLTAYSSEKVREKAFNLSATYVLEKPYDIKDLLQKVKELIGI